MGMCVYVCPLNNISFYYSAYIQFCQVFFYIYLNCDIIALDKIGNRVYNVIRNPQGAYISILRVNVQLPPRVFQGILSEYLALKCSPIVVYIDLGYFLVIGYVCIYGVPLPPACTLWGDLVFYRKNLVMPLDMARG